MAEKTFKASKTKVTPRKSVPEAVKKFVLVGTYQGGQLESWPGYYNYPIFKDDKIEVEACKKVNEIWLFSGQKSGRCFSAEFVGVKTRDELKKDFGYPAKGKGHGGGSYLLFKISKTELYNPATGLAEQVIVRAKDFARRSPKVAKQLKAYLESPDRKDPVLKNLVPPILTKLPREVLRVCEAAVQLDFMQIMFSERQFPAVAPLEYIAGTIKRDPQTEIAIPQTEKGRAFRLGEFFCGPGGLACGALSASIENPLFRIEHAWSNDYDRQTCNTYAENICYDHPETVICHDVRKLRLDDPRLTPIDGFAFGFPCNDFSVVGEHKGIDGDYGPLYQYGVAVLRKFQPIWFVAENVGGLASANEGVAFKKILESMKEVGYRIYPHLYKFEDYGVPQSRHRIIIVGIRGNQPQVFNPPSPALLAPWDNSAKAA